jgi:carbon monoxide dehydrogenase subunit G
VQYEHQVVIASPVSRVFAYMDDVSREREWQPAIIEAHKDPPGETAVGTRKRYVSQFMGRRIENSYVTTLFERDERIFYETTPGSVLQAKVELHFEPEGAGTRVTMAFRGELTGPLRFIPQGILEGAYRKEMKSTLDLLKQRLEGVV